MHLRLNHRRRQHSPFRLTLTRPHAEEEPVTEHSQMPTEVDDTPGAKNGTSKRLGRINNELNQIAALIRPLTAAELMYLDDHVALTRDIAASHSSRMFRTLHQRAKLIRECKAPYRKPAPPKPVGRRSVLPAGLVRSHRLTEAGPEVLGDLPLSRRGH